MRKNYTETKAMGSTTKTEMVAKTNPAKTDKEDKRPSTNYFCHT